MKTIYDFIEATNTKRRITKKKRMINNGFENLKNNELKFEFQNCEKLTYNSRKHIKLNSLGFKTIYQLDALGKRRWSNYFKSGGRVYLISYSTKLPLYKRILFDKKICKYIGKDAPLPLKDKIQKREYVKGGKNGKVNGFNFYFIEDKKMLPKHRKMLLAKSEHYIGIISDEQTRKRAEYLDKDIHFLDPHLTDIEIADDWNLFFMKYGYRFPVFEKQWYEMYAPKDDKEFLDSVSNIEDSEASENFNSPLRFNITRILKPTITNLG
jgi:hypothetical protein